MYVHLYIHTYTHICTGVHIYSEVKCLTNSLIKPKYKQHYNSISTVQ